MGADDWDWGYKTLTLASNNMPSILQTSPLFKALQGIRPAQVDPQVPAPATPQLMPRWVFMLQDQCTQIQEQLTRARSDAATQTLTHHHERDVLARQKVALEAAKQAITLQRDTAQAQLETANQAHADHLAQASQVLATTEGHLTASRAHCEKLKDDCKALELEKGSLQNTVNGLRIALEAATSDKSAIQAEHDKTLAALERVSRDHKVSVFRLDVVSASLKAATSNLGRMEADLATVRESLATALQQKVSLEVKNAVLIHANEELSTTNANLVHDLATEQDNLSAAESRANAFQEDTQVKVQQLRVAQDQVKACEGRIQTFEEREAEQDAKFAAMQQRIAELEARNTTLAFERNAALVDAALQKTRADGHEAALEATQRELADERADFVQAIEAKDDELLQQRCDADVKYGKLRSRMVTRVEQLKRDNEQLTRRAIAAEQEAVCARQETASVKVELESTTKEVRRLHRSRALVRQVTRSLVDSLRSELRETSAELAVTTEALVEATRSLSVVLPFEDATPDFDEDMSQASDETSSSFGPATPGSALCDLPRFRSDSAYDLPSIPALKLFGVDGTEMTLPLNTDFMCDAPLC